ncbi:MAG: MerR family transcriptional regulator [Megasphaera massiliensis]|uniref:MerR family transcriptional regulator n=1 Tax=Megasphaera massiliensis TaxID=1232428 RepID=UPI00210AEA6F|nr:MerR family transcriptional regulator [Megasphaera massiliensis]MCQ5210940.1 MerR family transcriptional regulator [Megasphaera massiliensis]MEE0659636.1 MerR family transcriptional regulator [Megasphaera massiliensis]
MKIKDVSEQLHISPDTLRYYEKIGLIRNVPRDKNGIRDYSEENCKSISFIKCMRAANVSISGLTRYMELFEKGDATRKERRQILVNERNQLQSNLQDIQDALSHLDWKIKLYDEGKF